jgi:hypothetical protein
VAPVYYFSAFFAPAKQSHFSYPHPLLDASWHGCTLSGLVCGPYSSNSLGEAY